MSALICPQGHPISSPGTRFCGVCGVRLTATAHGGEPTCAAHPHLQAAGICERCGAFACGECLAPAPGSDQGWCAACRSRSAELLPWDRRGELGVARAFRRTALPILLSPRRTFELARPHGTLGSSLLFGAISVLVQLSGTMVFYFLLAGVAAMALFKKSTGIAEGGLSWAIVGGVVVVMLLFVVGLGVAGIVLNAALDHLVLRLVGVKPGSWEVTLRASMLCQAPSLLGIIPFCGPYVAPIWTLILKVFAYQAFHRITGARAAAGALAIPGLVLLLGLAGYVAMYLFASSLLDRS